MTHRLRAATVLTALPAAGFSVSPAVAHGAETQDPQRRASQPAPPPVPSPVPVAFDSATLADTLRCEGVADASAVRSVKVAP